MKKVLTVFVVISTTVAMFLVLAKKPHPKIVMLGNTVQKPVDIVAHAWQCSECKMPIETKKYAGEVVSKEGKTWFFDDVGCLAAWLRGQRFRDSARVWVFSIDTKRWIDGRQAWYSVFESTPMGYGFGAYENEAPGRIDFKTMTERMASGENLTNRAYAKKLRKRMEETHGSH